ncbi:MAG: DUF4145 domain-containing protein [Alphaproteobacteria bacterium]
MDVRSDNFGFLAQYDAQLVRHAALAERYFAEDPSTSLIKLRQFSELLAQQVAARTARLPDADEKAVDVLRRLSADWIISRDVADLFHQLRIAGNRAVHDGAGGHRADAGHLVSSVRPGEMGNGPYLRHG